MSPVVSYRVNHSLTHNTAASVADEIARGMVFHEILLFGVKKIIVIYMLIFQFHTSLER